MGAWIEIRKVRCAYSRRSVAPLVGAWIEIYYYAWTYNHKESLPLWERGLKFDLHVLILRVFCVAPLVGAWIEILGFDIDIIYRSRSPCGSVD